MDHPAVTARTTTAEMLARPGGFDTAARNSHRPLIAFVRHDLDTLGVPHRIGNDDSVQEAVRHAIIAPAEAWRLAVAGPFDDGFRPPRTTAHPGTMHGSSMLNIIPEHAEFIMGWRNISGDDPGRHSNRMKAHVAQRPEPAMKAVHPNAGLGWEVRVGPSQIAQAEQTDECTAQSQLDARDSFIRRLSDHLLN